MSDTLENRRLRAHGHLQLLDHSGIKPRRLNLRVRISEISGDLVTMKGVTQLSTELVDMFMSVCTTEKSIVGTDSGAITSFSFFPFPLPNRKSNKSGVLFFPKKRCATRGVVAENSWREGTDVSIRCIHGRSNYCKNGRTSITIMNSYSVCLLQSASTRFCN